MARMTVTESLDCQADKRRGSFGDYSNLVEHMQDCYQTSPEGDKGACSFAPVAFAVLRFAFPGGADVV